MRPGSTASSLLLLALILLLAGCRSPMELAELTSDLEPSELTPEEFLTYIPNYSEQLYRLSGNGRLLISQPGQSERITLDFRADKSASLISFRNQIGIEGGQILVEGDSLLVYNRVDNVARKGSLEDAELTDVSSLATINIIDLFHFPLHELEVTTVFQDPDQRFWIAETTDGTMITVDRAQKLVREVRTRPASPAPYSRIRYESYDVLNNFFLPRKITIFNSDADSRVTFLVRQLQVNPVLPELTIDIPEEIPVHPL